VNTEQNQISPLHKQQLRVMSDLHAKKVASVKVVNTGC